MTTLSVLDLCPINEGSTASDALANSADLALHAEQWGYERFWLAEHHNMPGIGSAATAVVIGHVAAATSRIRVGAGGVMLPNHAPLVIAEQFGTLDALFPGRIDLGLGRAPGTDQNTMRALRRSFDQQVDRFPDDVLELQRYLGGDANALPRGNDIYATPGAGSQVPIWILGSSLYGAQLAARLGLPYAFASHFAPQMLDQAIAVYRSQFQPSAQLDKPYVMLGYNICGSDTDEAARYLASSGAQMLRNLRLGRPTKLPPPVDHFEASLQPTERAMLDATRACSAIGSKDTMRSAMHAFIERTEADELMLAAHIYDHDARLRSYEMAAEVCGVA